MSEQCKIFFFPNCQEAMMQNVQPKPRWRIEKELANGVFMYSEETEDFGGFRSCGLCNADGKALTEADFTPNVRVLKKHGLVIMQTVSAFRNRHLLVDIDTGEAKGEGYFSKYKVFGKWLLIQDSSDSTLRCWAVFNLKTRTSVLSILKAVKK